MTNIVYTLRYVSSEDWSETRTHDFSILDRGLIA